MAVLTMISFPNFSIYQAVAKQEVCEKMSSEEKGGIRLDAWRSEKARRGELDPQRKGKHIASRKSSTAFSTYSILRNL